MMTTDWYVTTA